MRYNVEITPAGGTGKYVVLAIILAIVCLCAIGKRPSQETEQQRIDRQQREIDRNPVFRPAPRV